MADSPSPNKSRSAIQGISRFAVGRATGRASRFVGASSRIQATARYLHRQLWAWPIIAAVLFGGAGWWVHRTVEDAMRRQREEALGAVVDTTKVALRTWISDQKDDVQLIADDETLRTLTQELLRADNGNKATDRELIQSRAQDAIRARLKAKLKNHCFAGYFIVSEHNRIIAADQDAAVGNELTGYRAEIFAEAHAGRPTVSRPFRSPLLLPNAQGELQANLPSMFVTGAIRDEAGQPIAALGLRIRPEDHFTRILQVARFGESGEVYAFDRSGLLLSQSRFNDGLKQLGLLTDLPDSQSILTIELRDPGVNMVRGERPTLRRAEQPLTRVAADAVQGRDGHDVEGHRDYRGVPSVGAWRWLPEEDFGIATEVDVDEAFRPLIILRHAFWSLMSLLGLSALGIFFGMIFIARQQRALQSATLAARQLGQYKLEEKLGAGGMGTVYKASHAMLRRPTAVKLLDVDKISDAAVARFEREVQLTGTLTHPNTVAVFDYGRTPEGIFYYAMEYLEGLNLDDLVSRTGRLPEARAMFILRQICGSLAEAHAAGMVHRDIKPANVLLTRRGGLCDFVKVLDFGLAKDVGSAEQANVTSPNALMGTPLYLSPEAVTNPDEIDSRSDVYAVGAVAYFLLTGMPVFDGATIMEICMKHTKEPPVPPSKRTGLSFNSELEALLMRCLSKVPGHRPRDAGALLVALENITLDTTWSSQNAAAWWAARDSNATVASPVTAVSPPDTSSPELTLAYEEPADSSQSEEHGSP